MTSADSEEIAKLSYEQARDELVSTVQKLEQGGITLEESLSLWERGEALANRCESWLVHAKERLETSERSPEQDPDSKAHEGSRSSAPAEDTPVETDTEDAETGADDTFGSENEPF
jgi:exodeoxyribonuclease VII small subunit